MKRIAVVGVPGSWSSESLADAIAERTGFRCVIDLGKTTLDLTTGKVWFQDVELGKLDGIMVKKLGPSYSPKLLDRLEILHWVANQGVPVFSKPQSIARLLNRMNCTLELSRGGIPIPPTFITEDPEAAAKAVESFGRAVLKPLYTSKARGMALVDAEAGAWEDVHNYVDSGNGIIYVQKWMPLPGQDLGIVFLGGQYVATYARVGKKGAWNTTTASGGKYQPYEPDDSLIELADRAQKIFGLDFTCVDVAETDQGPVVFEVSAFGGFRGLKESCGLDAGSMYADYVIREVGP